MFNELFSSIANRFQTWLSAANDGTLVTNNRLDYLNRAQEWLQMERAWDGQIVATTLTVANSLASLPEDYISLIAIGHDQESDGKAEWHYYKDGKQGHGYRLVSTFTKADGQSWQIQLFNGWPYVPNLVLYQKKLDKFVDSGDEYSFFPGELLLKTAQLLRVVEYRPNGKEYNTILGAVRDLLKKYKKLQYQNNDMGRSVLDDQGNPIVIETYNLSGGMQKEPSYRENSRDS